MPRKKYLVVHIGNSTKNHPSFMVRPRWRRFGMLMKWGMDKAAEMGVEIAVESSDDVYGL